MAGTCTVCGGLIPASNEVLGYSGPICNGMHPAHSYQHSPDPTVYMRLAAVETELAKLRGYLENAQTSPPNNDKGVI